MAHLKAGSLALRIHGPASGDSVRVLVCLQPTAFMGPERRAPFFGYIWGDTGMHVLREAGEFFMSLADRLEQAFFP